MSYNSLDELPSIDFMIQLFENTTASTYPDHILQRRLKLLTKVEKLKVATLWAEVCEKFEEMDNIIANRAEEANDPWK